MFAVLNYQWVTFKAVSIPDLCHIFLLWSIVYIEGSQILISKNVGFLSLEIIFVLANDVFQLGFHCLPKYAL